MIFKPTRDSRRTENLITKIGNLNLSLLKTLLQINYLLGEKTPKKIN